MTMGSQTFDQDLMLVNNPSVPGEVLAGIAERRPDLWPKLLGHPSMYPELAQWISVQYQSKASAASTGPSTPQGAAQAAPAQDGPKQGEAEGQKDQEHSAPAGPKQEAPGQEEPAGSEGQPSEPAAGQTTAASATGDKPATGQPDQGNPAPSQPSQAPPTQGPPTQGPAGQNYPSQGQPSQGMPTQQYSAQPYSAQQYSPQQYSSQGQPGQAPAASPSPDAKDPKKKKMLIFLIAGIAAVVIIAAGVAAFFLLKPKPTESAAFGDILHWDGKDMHCSFSRCVGVTESGDATVVQFDWDEAVIEDDFVEPGAYVGGSTLDLVLINHDKKADEAEITNPGYWVDSDTYEWDSVHVLLPSDTVTITTTGDSVIAVTEDGTAWRSVDEWPEEGTGTISDFEEVPFVGDVLELLPTYGMACAITEDPDDGAQLYECDSEYLDESYAIELPGEFKSAFFGLVTLTDDTIVWPEEDEDSYWLGTIKAPAPVVGLGAELDSDESCYLLDNGEVYCGNPEEGDTFEEATFQMDYPEPVTAIGWGMVLLSNGEVWTLEEDPEEIPLDSKAEDIAGFFWVKLENGDLAFVDANEFEVYLALDS